MFVIGDVRKIGEAWKATDGVIFEDEREARNYQFRITFAFWYKAHPFKEYPLNDNSLVVKPSFLLDWIKENRIVIGAFIQLLNELYPLEDTTMPSVTPELVTCRLCNGAGIYAGGWTACPKCDGSGKVASSDNF